MYMCAMCSCRHSYSYYFKLYYLNEEILLSDRLLQSEGEGEGDDDDDDDSEAEWSTSREQATYKSILIWTWSINATRKSIWIWVVTWSS